MIVAAISGTVILFFYGIFKNTGKISDYENCNGYCKSCRARGKCSR